MINFLLYCLRRDVGHLQSIITRAMVYQRVIPCLDYSLASTKFGVVWFWTCLTAQLILLSSNPLNYASWWIVPFGVHCTTCLGCVLTTPNLHVQIQVLGLKERSWCRKIKPTFKTLLSSSEAADRSRPDSPCSLTGISFVIRELLRPLFLSFCNLL